MAIFHAMHEDDRKWAGWSVVAVPETVREPSRDPHLAA